MGTSSRGVTSPLLDVKAINFIQAPSAPGGLTQGKKIAAILKCVKLRTFTCMFLSFFSLTVLIVIKKIMIDVGTPDPDCRGSGN